MMKGTILEMAGLIFNKIDKYEPGIIYSLLSQSYEEILDQQLKEQFRLFDKDVFENSDTIGACTFITSLCPDTIGMASYDPRQAPELATIGHNCVLPKYRKKGFGRQQILEIIKRLKLRNVSRISASTSEHSFFEPAQKMYLSCGFTELERKKRQPHDQDKTIYYELNCKSQKGA
jgi:GNAT superfamily N-acetyltransferase